MAPPVFLPRGKLDGWGRLDPVTAGPEPPGSAPARPGNLQLSPGRVMLESCAHMCLLPCRLAVLRRLLALTLFLVTDAPLQAQIFTVELGDPHDTENEDGVLVERSLDEANWTVVA